MSSLNPFISRVPTRRRLHQAWRDLAVIAGTVWMLAPGMASGGVLWSEEFDDAGASARWAVEGDWSIGPVTGGPGAAVSGAGVAATGLAGQAGAASSRRISMLSAITIPSASVSPRLRFRHWHQFALGSQGRVQVRRQGMGWSDLGASPVEGKSKGWEWVCLALGNFSGETIEIGFLCEGAVSAAAAGWYLDDLEVVDGDASDYAAWRSDYFSGAYPDSAKEVTVWGDDADPDQDGCPNLLEFIMHRNPVVPDSGLGCAPRLEGGDFVITFRETSSVIHDVRWLGFWSNLLDGWIAGGVRYEMMEERTGYRIMEARIARNRESRMYFRLEAWRD